MGLPKFFGGKRHVSATHVRVIEDPNEIYHHMLKSLYVSLQLRNPGGGNFVKVSLQPFSLLFSIRLKHEGGAGHELTLERRVNPDKPQRTITRQMSLRPTNQPTQLCHLYNEISWRSSIKINQMMGCTSRQSLELSLRIIQNTRARSSCKLKLPSLSAIQGNEPG